jgi:hypothetical protein
MRPEPHYFYYSSKYANPISWYEKTWFSEYAGQKAAGERSSSYLYLPACAERIYRALPKVNLIFILRNPVERTWANYRYTVLSGLEDLDFESALDHEAERVAHEEGIWAEVQPHDYTGRGFYGKQIQRYLQFFSWDQILIISSEKARNETQAQIDRVCRFLEVEPFDQFKATSDFMALSVKDPKVQVECRNYFKENFNEIVESYRRKDRAYERFILNDRDAVVFEKLKANLCDTKLDLNPRLRERLSRLFDKDVELFFSLTRGHIDFDRSAWFPSPK